MGGVVRSGGCWGMGGVVRSGGCFLFGVVGVGLEEWCGVRIFLF